MKKHRIVVALGVCLMLGSIAAVAQAAGGDTLGVSTLVQRILPSGAPGYDTLTIGAGEDYIVRDGSEGGGVALGTAGADRTTKRTSLSYFGQLTDFQLADEESPARVEFLDSQAGAFSAAWRPAEALNPQEENAMIEQMNAFAQNAPVPSGDNSKPGMDFVMNTGDIADSQQYNEVLWNRQLLEGGTVNPDSGVAPPPPGTDPLCPASLPINDLADPNRYTGVQDRNDWPTASPALPDEGYFYAPNDPGLVAPTMSNLVPYFDAPEYPGLMDRAQQPFQATGLDVPGYVLFGNHDGLVQGNAYASDIFNQLAKGCMKPMADAAANGGQPVGPLYALLLNANLTQQQFLDLYTANPDLFTGVPPDPQRRLVSKKSYMDIFKANGEDDGHGFGFVDPAEAAASNGSAGYYSWNPKPGLRYITLDTHSEGGKILESDNGNLDTPQFNWLESQLQQATTDNEIVVIFSHHGVTSLTAEVPDENAPSCAVVDPAVVTGCDADPRVSTPMKYEDEVRSLVLNYPNVIAWVAGHSHVNKVTPYKNPNGDGGFWSIRTAALADWPKQNRLLQIFDNEDGNLSIFGTLIDEASPVPTPAPGTSAEGMTTSQLASIAREIGYNDSQSGGRQCAPDPCGEGTAADRNVELLIKDPRRPEAARINKVTVSGPKKVKQGKKVTYKVKISNNGGSTATGIRLKVSGRGISFNTSVGKIAAGKTRTVNVKVKPGKPGKIKATFKVTSSNAGGKTVKKTITVKKKK